jgi:hypothetical protein
MAIDHCRRRRYLGSVMDFRGKVLSTSPTVCTGCQNVMKTLLRVILARGGRSSLIGHPFVGSSSGVKPALQNMHRRGLVDTGPALLLTDPEACMALRSRRPSTCVHRRAGPGSRRVLRTPCAGVVLRRVRCSVCRDRSVTGSPTTTSTTKFSSMSSGPGRTRNPAACRWSAATVSSGVARMPSGSDSDDPDTHGADVETETTAPTRVVVTGTLRIRGCCRFCSSVGRPTGADSTTLSSDSRHGRVDARRRRCRSPGPWRACRHRDRRCSGAIALTISPA